MNDIEEILLWQDKVYYLRLVKDKVNNAFVNNKINKFDYKDKKRIIDEAWIELALKNPYTSNHIKLAYSKINNTTIVIQENESQTK